MCRHEIPSDFLEHPKIVELASAYEEFEGGYQWFYEGRNGKLFNFIFTLVLKTLSLKNIVCILLNLGL